MKQSKKYIILHIETGEYLKSNNLKIEEFNEIYINIPSTSFRITTSLTQLLQNSIKRTDFSLKRDAIYFKDKSDAITFLRDIYLPIINNSWYREYGCMRRFYRNEFDIVEVNNV